MVPKSYANYLSTSAQYTTDQVAKSKFKEDLKCLNNMYDFDGDERVGTVEAFDKALSSSARKRKPQKAGISAPVAETPSCSPQLELSSDDDSTSVSSADSDLILLLQKRRKILLLH